MAILGFVHPRPHSLWMCASLHQYCHKMVGDPWLEHGLNAYEASALTFELIAHLECSQRNPRGAIRDINYMPLKVLLLDKPKYQRWFHLVELSRHISITSFTKSSTIKCISSTLKLRQLPPCPQKCLPDTSANHYRRPLCLKFSSQTIFTLYYQYKGEAIPT